MDASRDGVLRDLQSTLISGLTYDVETVYDKAISKGLVGARSVAAGKKERARDLVTAIIARVATDTTSKPSPLDMFMAILRDLRNLEYLAKEIEVKLTNLEQSESADFHPQSSTGDSGIQHAPSRSSNTESHPVLGAGGSNPHYSQHEPQKFPSDPHATQPQSSVDLEEEKQKHVLYQETRPLAETSSTMVPSSESVGDEYPEGKKLVQSASDSDPYRPTVPINDSRDPQLATYHHQIHHEAVTRELKKEVVELKEDKEHLSAELSEQAIAKRKALKLSEQNMELKDIAMIRVCREKKRNVELKSDLDKCKTDLEGKERNVLELKSDLEKCKTDLEEKEINVLELEGELEKCQTDLEEKENELETCKKDLEKRGKSELELKIELERCKNELEEQKRNELNLESKLEECKSQLDVMKRNSRELESVLEKMTI